MVRLEKVTKYNYQDCLALKVSKDQNHLVSPNMLSLAKAYVFYDIATPIAIYTDDLMVGFMLLRFNEEYSNYFIWQFMIDERYQSNGYGKQALSLAIDWMKKDKRCLKIVTTYIDGNEHVKKLYTKLGFQQMVGSEHGEIDMTLDF